jgi:hypothetical protein
MQRRLTQRKCKPCQTCFAPDPRSAGRQRYCSAPACRHASKAASQRRWLLKPANREYVRGPTHVERVRQWRQAHPGSWRRKAPKAAHAPDTLQEDLTPPETQRPQLANELPPQTFQDAFFMQPTLLVGLIAHLTGLS